MARATFSFDVDPASPSAQTILARVGALAGAHHATRLLTHLWELEFASIAAFDDFADALEALHAANPAAFDYDAVHFDAASGMVEVAPNPAVRRPHPVPATAGATPSSPAAPALLAARGVVPGSEAAHAGDQGLSAVGPVQRSRARRGAAGRPRGGGARAAGKRVHRRG